MSSTSSYKQKLKALKELEAAIPGMLKDEDEHRVRIEKALLRKDADAALRGDELLKKAIHEREGKLNLIAQIRRELADSVGTPLTKT